MAARSEAVNCHVVTICLSSWRQQPLRQLSRPLLLARPHRFHQRLDQLLLRHFRSLKIQAGEEPVFCCPLVPSRYGPAT